MKTWRDLAKQRIAEVLAEYPNAEGKELDKLLRDAYPFGERRMHPYKIWLSEVKKTKSVRNLGYSIRNFWIQ